MSSFQYRDFIRATAELFLSGLPSSSQAAYASIPGLTPVAHLAKNPKVLIIAPHPDDECLMGGYALRMQEEWGAQVFVLPFSYGSDPGRQGERKNELNQAVSRLGFELLDPRVSGSFGSLTTSEVESAALSFKPQVIFSPHEFDAHPTHQRAYAAARQAALTLKGMGLRPLWVQTEYWGELQAPNLLVPLSNDHVTKLGEALMLHQGEIERNPYHLRLPAWLMDQVRKGSERVAGKGQVAQPTVYGQLYFQQFV